MEQFQEAYQQHGTYLGVHRTLNHCRLHGLENLNPERTLLNNNLLETHVTPPIHPPVLLSHARYSHKSSLRTHP